MDDRMKVMSMDLIWEIWIMWFVERRDKLEEKMVQFTFAKEINK